MKDGTSGHKLPPRMHRRRRDRRFRLKLDLRKALFVLPNLFTVSSIFCGFYAMVLVSGDPGPGELYRATLAVFFGAFFDGADGRVARLTRTQSEFGMQMDSLADVITFGVAPAVVVHKWGLHQLNIVGTLAAFLYVACGAIRLARFNVMAARGSGSTRFFVGLPIPLAAGVLMSLVMFHQRTYGRPAQHTQPILALTLVVAYLMVSNVRYRTFKNVRVGRKSLTLAALFVLVFVVLAIRVRPAFALLICACSYVGLGLVEEVIFFRRRRHEERVPVSRS